LGSLGEGREPIVQGFEAGAAAPRQAGALPFAQRLPLALDDDSAFVVNPAAETTYSYADGMHAPLSRYHNRGHQPRAAIVHVHSPRELAPGVYGSTVKMPAAGTFDVAFLLNQPQIIHCFSTGVAAVPGAAARRKGVHAEFLGSDQP